jgi:hypothetical protein
MEKLLSFSTDQKFSTGQLAQRTFSRTGKIYITFFIHNNRIGAEIEGFEIQTRFVKKPKNQKEKNCNKYFVDRFIKPCHNANELFKIFKIDNE